MYKPGILLAKENIIRQMILPYLCEESLDGNQHDPNHQDLGNACSPDMKLAWVPEMAHQWGFRIGMGG
jgi:hypothetical protein